MSSGLQVVEGVENYPKAAKPLNVELRVLDVRMIWDDLDVRVELLRSLCGDLETPCTSALRFHGPLRLGQLRCNYQRFRLLDVFLSKEKLSIQVAKVDCVEVDDVRLSKAGQDEVLE